uniref:Uncharacterized protein n=1 Tax=Hippocampus comes TaxID=109280 RepID=A0A3Q2Y344_HIPCM
MQVNAKSKGWSCDTAVAPNTHRLPYNPSATAAAVSCAPKVCSFSSTAMGAARGTSPGVRGRRGPSAAASLARCCRSSASSLNSYPKSTPPPTQSPLAYLCHDDRSGHIPPLPAVGQLAGVAGRREKLAVAEAQQVELINGVLRMSGQQCRLAEERLRKLQRCLHRGALRNQGNIMRK